MTKTEPPQLGPQDFEECFRGEPALPDVAGDLARGRRRRRRSVVLVSAAVTAVAATAGLGLALTGSSTQTAVPVASSAPPPSVSVVPNPSPDWTMSTGPGPSEPAPSAGPDTAPPLTYSKTEGYLDRNGMSGGLNEPVGAFAATTRHTYDLIRLQLDPERAHLGAYERDALAGGGGTRVLEVGQELSWKVEGEAGKGSLLVSVTRAAPGRQVVTKGDDRDGLCGGMPGDPSGTPGGPSCKPAAVDGHPVFLDRQANGGFVVDYVQPDGELASAWVNRTSGTATPIPLEKMGISLSAVVALLTDPDLDIVG